MEYYYESGSVRRISELTANGSKLIYQHKQSLLEMMTLFKSDVIEREIAVLRLEIDSLLDCRFTVQSDKMIGEIDGKLAAINQRLIELEL